MAEGMPHELPTSPDVPALSLIIPAFNEADRLEAGFARLHTAISSGAIVPEQTQFVLVDDGSTDHTSDCAASLFGGFAHTMIVRLPENRGKGAAVRAGVTVATAPIVAFADADMAIDPNQTPQFLAALDRADLAIGSRAASGAHADRPDLRRSVMNRTFNHLVNVLTRVGLDDTQCGFKAFRGSVARLLFHCSTTERMAFDVEILTLARQLKLSIAQVPVQWSRVEGSRVQSWSDSRSMVGDVLRARRKSDTAPGIPSLTVSLTRDLDEADQDALSTLARIVPVFRPRPNEVVVLLPLMDETKIDAHALALGERFGPDTLGLATMTLSSLRALAPLTLAWHDREAAHERA
jgi:hypothetical protein